MPKLGGCRKGDSQKQNTKRQASKMWRFTQKGEDSCHLWAPMELEDGATNNTKIYLEECTADERDSYPMVRRAVLRDSGQICFASARLKAEDGLAHIVLGSQPELLPVLDSKYRTNYADIAKVLQCNGECFEFIDPAQQSSVSLYLLAIQNLRDSTVRGPAKEIPIPEPMQNNLEFLNEALILCTHSVKNARLLWERIQILHNAGTCSEPLDGKNMEEYLKEIRFLEFQRRSKVPGNDRDGNSVYVFLCSFFRQINFCF